MGLKQSAMGSLEKDPKTISLLHKYVKKEALIHMIILYYNIAPNV